MQLCVQMQRSPVLYPHVAELESPNERIKKIPSSCPLISKSVSIISHSSHLLFAVFCLVVSLSVSACHDHVNH